MAASTGAGVKEIMYRIGHSSPQAALRYQHASARRDFRIAQGISDLIRRVSAGHDTRRFVTVTRRPHGACSVPAGRHRRGDDGLSILWFPLLAGFGAVPPAPRRRAPGAGPHP